MTHSRKSSDSVNPSDRASRAQSSFTTSGTFVFNSEVALPNAAGKPVEREANALQSPQVAEPQSPQEWASREVPLMLGRVRRMVISEYVRLIGELGSGQA